MILQYRQVTRTFGSGAAAQPALRGVDLTLGSGEFAALVGPSGCGKTTLLNLAAGFDRPDGGNVRLCGRDLGPLTERELAKLRRWRVGFIFQTLNLIPTLTAAENIKVPLALCGLCAAEQNRRADELLRIAGLERRADAFPGQLSGGQQQRVAALRAVGHKPSIVLLDEPTSNLDSGNAQDLLDLLTQLNQAEGATLFMATHDDRVAGRAQRIIQLLDGRVVNDG
jgi:putative ABC transport system ATP-binding protein